MPAVPLDLLHVSPWQPPAPLPGPPPTVALARAVGFVDPVTVRPLPGTTPPRYEILTGLRHCLLAQRAELATVHIHLRDSLSDDEARRLVELDAGPDGRDPLPKPGHPSRGLTRPKHCRRWARDGAVPYRSLASVTAAAARPQRASVGRPGELEIGKARALVGLPERSSST